MFFKKKQVEVLAPVAGTVIKIEEVKDPVFSSKMLGNGFAIIPDAQEEVTFISPIAGTLTTSMESGHAYGITEKSTKVECLVHIGMDTVELNGNGFNIKATKGQKLAQKQELATVNLKVLKQHKKDTTTPVVFTTETLDENNYEIRVLKYGKVQQGEVVAELVKK